VQRELDDHEEGLRSGRLAPHHRSRGRLLSDIRARQKRLDNLACEFGFRRVWRKQIRVRPLSQVQVVT
jgi:hypothetical protein